MTVIAVDGPAASGKGTIARAIAARFGLAYLDTGVLYRAVASLAMSEGPISAEAAIRHARSLGQDALLREDLRTAEVGQGASIVAAIPEVREALVAFQRGFAKQPRGAVLDGRDIGTVICPDADVKLFVTASDRVRAQRRHAELATKDPGLTVEQVLRELKERDARDAARDIAPMKRAEDATLLDTSALEIDEAIAAAAKIVISATREPG